MRFIKIINLNFNFLKKFNDRNKCIVAFCCFFLLLSAVYGVVIARPVSSVPGNAKLVVIEPGMGTQQIAELLYTSGLIKNTFAFRLFAKLEGADGMLKAGEYQLTPEMSVKKIITTLAKGETTYRNLVIPEGYTINQIADLIEKKQLGSAEKFKRLAKNYAPLSFMASNLPVDYQTEGFVFPDTYRIAKGATEEQMLATFVSQFNKQFSGTLKERAAQIGLNPRQVIILASLVEKEAQVETDRPIIAGVFLNRLKRDMPLQSCATIQYILGYPKPELSVKDTEIASPYNTYLNPGLPPGPISSPGLAAIQAVLYPANTNYLYFVAKKDGAHIFSATYEEHLAAIEQVN